jgi:hypothetical protein
VERLLDFCDESGYDYMSEVDKTALVGFEYSWSGWEIGPRRRRTTSLGSEYSVSSRSSETGGKKISRKSSTIPDQAEVFMPSIGGFDGAEEQGRRLLHHDFRIHGRIYKNYRLSGSKKRKHGIAVGRATCRSRHNLRGSGEMRVGLTMASTS